MSTPKRNPSWYRAAWHRGFVVVKNETNPPPAADSKTYPVIDDPNIPITSDLLQEAQYKLGDAGLSRMALVNSKPRDVVRAARTYERFLAAQRISYSLGQLNTEDPEAEKEYEEATAAWKWISFKLTNPDEAADTVVEHEFNDEWENLGEISRSLPSTLVGPSTPTQTTASTSVTSTARSVGRYAADFGSIVSRVIRRQRERNRVMGR